METPEEKRIENIPTCSNVDCSDLNQDLCIWIMSLVVWMQFEYEMPPFFPANSVFLLPTENKLVVDGMQHSWYSFVSSLKYAVWCLFLWRLHVNQCREQNVINDKFAHWKIEPDKCGSQRHWFVFGCFCLFFFCIISLACPCVFVRLL